MKKKLIILSLMLFMFLLGGCGSKEPNQFKIDYESLNGKESSSGKIYRTITIDEDNPFEKVEASKIVEMINNKETFYVYFGDELCPWCRSVIEKFIEVSKNKNIKKVYYVKIWDKEGTEILRSKFKLNESGELENVIKGTDDYYKLLTAFDSLLSPYTLTDSEGNKVETGEKRIFAPNFIYVENGVPVKLVEGISSKQTDSRGELTDEILKDEEEEFVKFFEK